MVEGAGVEREDEGGMEWYQVGEGVGNSLKVGVGEVGVVQS